MGRDTERRKFKVDSGITAEQKDSSFGALKVPRGLTFYKPKKTGSFTIDLVPFEVTDNRNRFVEKLRRSDGVGYWYPERRYWVHYGVGVNNEVFSCSASNFGKPCPICERRHEFLQHADAESQAKADALKPKERQLWLVYDRDESEKGVQLWEVSKWLFGEYLTEHIQGYPESKREPYRKYYDPDAGMTISVTCKDKPAGKGKPATHYLVHSMHPRSELLPVKLFEHGYDLDAIPQETEYSKLKSVFTGAVDPDDGDDDGPNGTPPAVARNSRNGDGDYDEPPRRAPAPAEPAAKWIPSVDDQVSFEFKGILTEGTVKKVDLDGKMVQVAIDGRPGLMKLDFSDLTLLDESWADKKPDPEPAEKPGWSDKNEDDGRSFQRNKGKGSKPAVDPQDDPGDEPAPPKRGRRGGQ